MDPPPLERAVSVLGCDVGGTKVVVGPVDRQGRLLAPPRKETTVTDTTQSFVAGITATMRRALEEFSDFNPQAIGLACAGTVDVQRGMVITSPNLPLREVPLGDTLRDALGMPVILDNDGNAAVLGEAVAGAAAGHRHVIMLTLGTGVGGGLLLDGRIYRGAGGGAGELGHIIVCPDGEPCQCGARGCLEMYASGRALVRFAADRAGDRMTDPLGTLASLLQEAKLDGVAVGELVNTGYPGALAAVQELAQWLGIGLVSLANIFNPEVIVLGGGVSDLGDLVIEPARKILHATAMAPNRDQALIVRAMLGNLAGLVGAGLEAWACAHIRGAESARDLSGAGDTGATAYSVNVPETGLFHDSADSRDSDGASAQRSG